MNSYYLYRPSTLQECENKTLANQDSHNVSFLMIRRKVAHKAIVSCGRSFPFGSRWIFKGGGTSALAARIIKRLFASSVSIHSFSFPHWA